MPQCHPDKISPSASAPERAAQTISFQSLSACYEVLSTPSLRAEYDDTGVLPGEEADGGDDVFGSKEEQAEMWDRYFRGMFERVSTTKIDVFKDKYKQSDEEATDVLKWYDRCKGDLNRMLGCVMLSEKKDKARWVKDIIEPAIKEGKATRYEALERTKGTAGGDEYEFGEDDDDLGDDDDEENEWEDDDEEDDNEDEDRDQEDAGKKKQQPAPGAKAAAPPRSAPTAAVGMPGAKPSRADREAAEAKALMDKILNKAAAGGGGNAQALSKKRGMDDDIIKSLEAKYGGNKQKGGKSGKQQEDISPEEWDRIQANLMKNKNSKGGGK